MGQAESSNLGQAALIMATHASDCKAYDQPSQGAADASVFINVRLDSQQPQKQRLHFIDWLRALVIGLVVAFHTIDLFADYTYSAGVYLGIVNTPPSDASRQVAIVCAQLIQSFFMGVMFLVSGFYCAPSYDRKGSARFLGDRALRVLLPLLVYDFFIQPLAFEIARHSPAAYPPLRDAGVNGFSFYFSTQLTRLGHGAGWFLAVLMMFDLAYVAARLCASAFCCCCSHSRRRSAEKDQEAPAAAGKSAADGSDDSQAASSAATEQQQQRPPFSGWATLAGALGVAALIAGLALLVRVGILIPLGLPVSLWTLVGIQCQPAYIPQYAIAFMLGLAAHRCDALRRLPAGAGPAAAAAAAVLAVAGGVLMTFMPGSNFGHELQRGASTSYVAVYAVWEAFYCVAMWVALLVCGRRWANHQGGRVGAAITGAAYAAYLVHVAVLAALGVAFAMVNWHPAAKCAVVTPLAVVSSWLIGIVLRCIPGVKRVL